MKTKGGKHIKTEIAFRKQGGQRTHTQIITVQHGVEKDVPIAGKYKHDENGRIMFDKKGKAINQTYDKPIIERRVIHHNQRN